MEATQSNSGSQILSLSLLDDNKIPTIGLGTYNSREGEVKKAVEHAIQIGYRHIDTAAFYKNEHEIGEAIEKCIANGVVTRSDIFLTSKLWNHSHHPEDVEWSCRESAKNLKVDYIDLYLIHWPVAYKRVNRDGVDYDTHIVDDQYDYVNTWHEMERLKDIGLVKSIGVSNFNVAQLTRLIDSAKHIPVVNQIEVHPYLQRENLIEFCDRYKILIEAYAPLGAPTSPFGESIKLMEDPVVVEIAKDKQCTPALVLLKYLIQRGMIVLPKSVTPHRIESNFQCHDVVDLTPDEIDKLRKLNSNKSYYKLCDMMSSKYYPWN